MAWTPLPDEVTLTITTPKPKAFELDPAKTLVVVVDMENYFCKNGNQRSYDVIAGNERLLAKARAAGAKVIFIQSVRTPEALEVTRFGRKPMLLEGTPDVEIVEEIAPLPGEPVIQKWGHDPFARTALDGVLFWQGITPHEWTVLVTGVSAAVCAHACAMGFSNRHYYTLIPMDCTAASIEDEARTYTQYMGGGYNFNMDFTLSTMVEFVSPSVESIAEPEKVPALV
ncbi:MAG: isochorismatase family cysteine hydrolase [Vicinamibacterales bacterium]